MSRRDSYTLDVLVDVTPVGGCSKFLHRLRKVLCLVKRSITDVDVDRELIDCRPNGAVEALDEGGML